MIIGDLHVVRVTLSPHEAYTMLIVDSDGVLSFAVSFQLFESIAGRYFQVIQFCSRIHHIEFTPRYVFDRLPIFDPLVVEQSRSATCFERLDHKLRV